MGQLLTRAIEVVVVDEDDCVYRSTVTVLDYTPFEGFEDWESPFDHILGDIQ